MNIADLLIFGALANDMFDMDVQNLNVEFHVMPYGQRSIRLMRVITRPNLGEWPMHEYYSTIGEYASDRVDITAFRNNVGEKIYMGYSNIFNTLIVVNDQDKETEDGYREKQYRVRSHEKEDGTVRRR